MSETANAFDETLKPGSVAMMGRGRAHVHVDAGFRRPGSPPSRPGSPACFRDDPTE